MTKQTAKATGTVEDWPQFSLIAGAVIRVDDASFAHLADERSHSMTLWRLTTDDSVGFDMREWLRRNAKRVADEVIDSGIPAVNELRLMDAVGILRGIGYSVVTSWFRGPGGYYAQVWATANGAE